MVIINGTEWDAAGKNLTEFLTEADYDPQKIVVERNEQIVPKAQYDQTTLMDGDRVEIISFMGGG